MHLFCVVFETSFYKGAGGMLEIWWLAGWGVPGRKDARSHTRVTKFQREMLPEVRVHGFF